MATTNRTVGFLFCFAFLVTAVLSSIEVPNGLFCGLICLDAPSLPGTTLHCLLSVDGHYQRFVARHINPFDWRFYQVDSTTTSNLLCKIALNGDNFRNNFVQNRCSNDKPAKRKQKRALHPLIRNAMLPDEDNEGLFKKKPTPGQFLSDYNKFLRSNEVTGDDQKSDGSATPEDAPVPTSESPKPSKVGPPSDSNSGKTQQSSPPGSKLISNVMQQFVSFGGIISGKRRLEPIRVVERMAGLRSANPDNDLSVAEILKNLSPLVASSLEGRIDTLNPEFDDVGKDVLVKAMSAFSLLYPTYICNTVRRQICRETQQLTCSYENGCCYRQINVTRCPFNANTDPPGKCFRRLSLILTSSN